MTKPTKEMMRDAKKLKGAREFIDPQAAYSLELPSGAIAGITGAEVIEASEAFAAFLEAADDGTAQELYLALRRVLAVRGAR